MRRLRLLILVGVVSAVALGATGSAVASAQSRYPSGARVSAKRTSLGLREGSLLAHEEIAYGCNAIFAGEYGVPCGSEIIDTNNPGYCMTSGGSTNGNVYEWTCNNDANQTWVAGAWGADDSWEIYNVGSSCPSDGGTYPWDSCGNPKVYESGYGYGYCVKIQGGTASNNAYLYMAGCGATGDVTGEAFYGVGTPSKAWLVDSQNYHYCISNLGNAGDWADYEMYTCNTGGNQTFGLPLANQPAPISAGNYGSPPPGPSPY